MLERDVLARVLNAKAPGIEDFLLPFLLRQLTKVQTTGRVSAVERDGGESVLLVRGGVGTVGEGCD